MKLIFFTFCILPVVAFSQSIKIGAFEVAPFYMSSNGKLTGVIYRLLKEIEAESGLKFEFKTLPYMRMIKQLKSQEIDLAVFYPNGGERAEGEFIKLCETLGNDNMIITKSPISSLSDLKGKSIAIIRGARYKKEFDNNTDIVKKHVNSYDQGIKMFTHKRVDGVVIPEIALDYYLSQKKFLKKDFSHRFLLSHKKNWIHVRMGLSDSIKSKIKAANENVLKKKNYKKLKDLLYTFEGDVVPRRQSIAKAEVH